MNRRPHRAMARELALYLDGEADPASAARVRRHVEQCWQCSEDAEWLVLIKAALGHLGDRRPVELAVARLSRYAESLTR